jgi:hypothetical protein
VVAAVSAPSGAAVLPDRLLQVREDLGRQFALRPWCFLVFQGREPIEKEGLDPMTRTALGQGKVPRDPRNSPSPMTQAVCSSVISQTRNKGPFLS